MITGSTGHRRPLRVAINAQVVPNSGSGGVETVLIGLVRALGALDNGEEEYIVIGPWQDPEWLASYVGSNQRIVRGPLPQRGARKGFRRRVLEPLLPAARRLRDLVVDSQAVRHVPQSDGFYESLACDVVHFPYQDFVGCGLPVIYNPHDLQHLHYPEFFSTAAIAWRETIYSAGCRLAHTVAVAAHCVKDDIVRNYGVDHRKIQVIPWSAPTRAYREPTPSTLAAVHGKYGLDNCFVLYPAMTWPHKNHLRLLEALVLLRDRAGRKLYLVCTGHQNSFWPQIQGRVLALGLQDQVRFLGLVPPGDMRAIYRLAQFVVIPTLFEGAGLPLFEAWQDDVPVACSSVTSLPEAAGDAAFLFDPLSVESIAEALARMATDGGLREALRHRGTRRLKEFSWERSAKAYRAVYRRAAGRPLTEEDRWLLGCDWTREPQHAVEARV